MLYLCLSSVLSSITPRLVSWLLNHHPYFFFVVFLALCVLSFRIRLEVLGYASDFKNSKKSVSPYVSGFRFRFPPYGLLFGRSVLLQYLQHLFTPFRSYCTPWQPSQTLLYWPLQFIRAFIACSQALHILYVLIKCFFISNICFILYMNGCSYVYWWWTCVLPSVSIS